MKPFTTAALAALFTCCLATTHPVQSSSLGTAKSTADMVASLAEPGMVELETITAADWEVERSGLLNVEHPSAKDAGLSDGDEKIQVYFHALRHPTKGLFIVDTGMELALRDAPEKSAFSGIVRSAMHFEKLQVRVATSEWLAKETKLAGIFLTHLHLDHISGMRDVPNSTPIYVGLHETDGVRFLHLFVRGSTDAALEGKEALSQWQYRPDASGTFDGVVDIFGDGSVWAIWVPGHTPGSTAYLVRTKTGPVLLAGDACHTRWGWEHQVEPGWFTANATEGAKSFQRLQAFVAAHPQVQVRVGHQP